VNLYEQQLAVVLVRTRNPLNIGAVARAIQNFGVRELRLVTPFEASFREARSAVGAGAVLEGAREFASVADAVADCRLVVGTTAARGRELQQRLVSLEQAGGPLRAAFEQGRVALVFGSEKHGLTREDLEHCHWVIRIPTEDAQPSMNLGQAAAVCLWEIARERRTPAVEAGGETPAVSGELERLGALLMELLDAGGYLHSKTSTSAASEVRLLLRRLHVTDEDTYLLMGMVRKLLWKLRAQRDE
jgi:TrmH family RNA methyltransferase